jgi:predicted GIY-YIG superfamily endonuclease
MEYPHEQIVELNKFKNKSCVYILEVEKGIYKYGLSRHIRNRLRTHYRDMRFMHVIRIFDCGFNAIMRQVETNIEKLAMSKGERINKYSKTEIIQTQNIEKYLDNAVKSINMLKLQSDLVDKRIEEDVIQIEIVVNDKNVNNKRCHLCDKVFDTPKDLRRHMNRKKPCIIPENENNTRYKCTNCNKTYPNKGNLNRHFLKCNDKKVKILDKPINYIQEIKTLKEQHAIDRKNMQEIIEMLKIEQQKLKDSVQIFKNKLNNQKND